MTTVELLEKLRKQVSSLQAAILVIEWNTKEEQNSLKRRKLLESLKKKPIKQVKKRKYTKRNKAYWKKLKNNQTE